MARKLISDADLGIKLAWYPPRYKENDFELKKELHKL